MSRHPHGVPPADANAHPERDAATRALQVAVQSGQARPHLITGKLAERALRDVLDSLPDHLRCGWTIQVMPITVAALMPPRWIAPRLAIPIGATHLVLPGYCDGDLTPILEQCPVPVVVGPRDLRDLPYWLTGRSMTPNLDQYSIEIIAEINHCPRLPVPEIIRQASELIAAGADVIDVGCDPGNTWRAIGTVVGELVGRGMRVSVDSFDPEEVALACAAGAELILSVNSSNRSAARDWGKEVVVVPDRPHDWQSLEESVDILSSQNVPLRIDPVLEPIGLGFAQSLQRYFRARQIWPDMPIMMGIGNVTELTDVDSAGVNMLLIGICQELAIGSVLTTQVVNWARSSVAECNAARRIAYRAVQSGIPAKRVSDQLVVLRDSRLVQFSSEELPRLAEQIRDHNLRVFAEQGELHVLGGGHHWRGLDPFAILAAIQEELRPALDAAHAFYLGFELAKAKLALQLGKQYIQDQPLRWGHLDPGP